MRSADREGMILLNVLLILAVAALAVTVMLVAQDVEVQRATRLREAAQANAYARAGEASALTALRRDALVAPATDHLREPWAATGQAEIAVPGGRFALAIEDEQGRFNLNALRTGAPAPIAAFQRIATAVDIPAETQVRIATIVRVAGPLTDTGLLRTAGVAPETLARLEPFVTVLPDTATLNVNTASEALLAIVLGDPALAGELVARRARSGFLTAEDLGAGGQAGAGAFGFTSNHFRVTTDVMVGATRQRLISRVTRVRSGQTVDVFVDRRRRAAG